MIRRVVERLALLVALLLAVSMLTFGAMNVLGDPLFNILGPVSACEDAAGPDGSGAVLDPDGNAQTCTQRQIVAVADAKTQYYLDRPLPERYARWLGDAIRGDFGTSFANQGESVTTIVGDRLPISLLLMLMAQIVALGVALPWGVWSASRAGSIGDRAGTVASFGLVSLPNFALGVILYYVFVVKLEWFPFRYDDTTFGSKLNTLLLPAVTLGLPIAAVYQRLLRSDLIATLQDDFILMARSKGLSRRTIMYRHALRPSLFSLLTVVGINAGALVGGTLVIEQIFSIPGAGTEIVTAVLREDFPVVLAFVVVITAGFVVLNMVVDLLYPVIDPRVRDER